MRLNKAEIKLRRLLASIPNQDNPRKLLHYVATARELLAVLTGDNGPQNLPSISSDLAREYADRIQDFADKLDINDTDIWSSLEPADDGELGAEEEEEVMPESSTSSSLRRRRQPESIPEDVPVVELDSSTQEHLEKHRRLQEGLTDKLVEMARQMKLASSAMGDAVQQSSKILDSAEDGINKSLASTKKANVKAKEVYSRGFKTACMTWLVIFAMFCVFLFMIAVIRVT